MSVVVCVCVGSSVYVTVCEGGQGGVGVVEYNQPAAQSVSG